MQKYGNQQGIESRNPLKNIIMEYVFYFNLIVLIVCLGIIIWWQRIFLTKLTFKYYKDTKRRQSKIDYSEIHPTTGSH